MPLYEYTCDKCKSGKSEMRTIDERLDAPSCNRCKKPMKFIVSAVTGFVKNPAAGHARRV